MIERTLVLVKPDGVSRGLSGEIIRRLEQRGLKILGMKMIKPTAELSKKHYTSHVGKPFYFGLEKYITEGPVIALVLEGVHAVSLVRKLVGDTEPYKSAPGTIRGDFAHMSMAYADDKGCSVKNLIHASGNPEEAEQEVKLWFEDSELHDYSRTDEGQTQ